MSELKNRITIDELLNYYEDLYDLYNRKYTVSMIKIEKLVVLSLILYYKKFNDSYFDENLTIKKHWCGFTISEFENCNRQIYTGTYSTTNSIDISVYQDEILELNNKYLFSDDIFDVLNKTFSNFGAYDPLVLGKLLDKFKSESMTESFVVGDETFNQLLAKAENVDEMAGFLN